MCIVILVKWNKNQSRHVCFCFAHIDTQSLYDPLIISECEIQKLQKQKVGNTPVPLSRYLRTDYVPKEVDYTSEYSESDQESYEEDYMEEDDTISNSASVACPLLQQAQKSYLRSFDPQSTNLLRTPQNDILVTFLTSTIIFLALAIVIKMLAS